MIDFPLTRQFVLLNIKIETNALAHIGIFSSADAMSRFMI